MVVSRASVSFVFFAAGYTAATSSSSAAAADYGREIFARPRVNETCVSILMVNYLHNFLIDWLKLTL